MLYARRSLKQDDMQRFVFAVSSAISQKLSQFRRINIFQTDEHMRVIRFLVRWSLQKCKRCRKQEVCA